MAGTRHVRDGSKGEGKGYGISYCGEVMRPWNAATFPEEASCTICSKAYDLDQRARRGPPKPSKFSTLDSITAARCPYCSARASVSFGVMASHLVPGGACDGSGQIVERLEKGVAVFAMPGWTAKPKPAAKTYNVGDAVTVETKRGALQGKILRGPRTGVLYAGSVEWLVGDFGVDANGWKLSGDRWFSEGEIR